MSNSNISSMGTVSQLLSRARSLMLSPALHYLANSQIPLFGSFPSAPPPAGPTVQLAGYGQFQGTVVNESLAGTEIQRPVTAWLGMPFAVPPTGKERFAVVGDPQPFDGVRKAQEYGDVCVQVGWPDPHTESEDCLSFNVFRPLDMPEEMEKLPVFVWVHGGGFQAGSARSFDGAAFVAAAKTPLIVVSFNYRLSSLGFLPAPFFTEAGIDNLGLRDQHYFLQFLKKHVASFGGDPDAITLGGRSAGAHSVGFHYQNESSSNPLFSKAVFQSGGPTARTFPDVNYPLYRKQYKQFMDGVGCDPTAENDSILACLRSADLATIKSVSSQIFAESEYQIVWPFQPITGGFLMEKAGSQRWRTETFAHIPTLTSSTTDEARFYSPTDLNTTAEFISFIHNLFPGILPAQLQHLSNALYPAPETDPSSPYRDSPISPQYTRISTALSDSFYICSSQETAVRVSIAGVPHVYKLRWDIADDADYPPYQGVPHTSDTKYSWDAPDVQFPEQAHALAAYLASFIATGDPNTRRYEGAPEWPAYEAWAGAGARQLRIGRGRVVVEKDDIRREACEFWRSIPGQMKH